MNSIYLKFHSVVTSMLYCKYFSSYKARQQDKKHISFICIPTRLMLHAFNYTIITYEYFDIWSWDKDDSTQHEMAIIMIYRFVQKQRLTSEKESLVVLKCLNNCCFLTFVNKCSQWTNILEYENDLNIFVLLT